MVLFVFNCQALVIKHNKQAIVSLSYRLKKILFIEVNNPYLSLALCELSSSFCRVELLSVTLT